MLRNRFVEAVRTALTLDEWDMSVLAGTVLMAIIAFGSHHVFRVYEATNADAAHTQAVNDADCVRSNTLTEPTGLNGTVH